VHSEVTLAGGGATMSTGIAIQQWQYCGGSAPSFLGKVPSFTPPALPSSPMPSSDYAIHSSGPWHTLCARDMHRSKRSSGSVVWWGGVREGMRMVLLCGSRVSKEVLWTVPPHLFTGWGQG
jgi:hypothetical protein